jgi:hypothetical protein
MLNFVGFGAAVDLETKSSLFCVILPCNRCFEGNYAFYRLHVLLIGLLFNPEDEHEKLLRNVG